MPKGKNQKVTGLMKDELGEKIMKEIAAQQAKTYKQRQKKVQRDKKVYRKKKLKFECYKHCLRATQLENQIKH